MSGNNFLYFPIVRKYGPSKNTTEQIGNERL